MDSKAIRIPPASTWRPWYSPMIVGSKSSLDTCMENSPFVGGCDCRRDAAAAGQKQKRRRPDGGGSEAGEEQRRAGAQPADGEAAERIGHEEGLGRGGDREDREGGDGTTERDRNVALADEERKPLARASARPARPRSDPGDAGRGSPWPRLPPARTRPHRAPTPA